MSEADTPNSNPINPSADPGSEHQPSPSFLPESSSEIVNPPPVSNESEFAVIEGTTNDDPVTVDFAQESDWFVQARKQRQRNRELVKTVAQLEQALVETQEELKAQGVRTKSSETLITQQAEELYTTQQQLSQLVQELETTYQINQRQQLLIDTLSEQLETAQQRVLILEEECNALRQLEQQQAQQLRQSQIYTEDLYTRLQSQQRQAQQFKAALDKCLESPHLRPQGEPDDFIPEVVAEVVAEEPEPLTQNDETTLPTSSAPELRPLPLASPRTNPADWGRRVQPWSLQLEQELDEEDSQLVNELSAIEPIPSPREVLPEVAPESPERDFDPPEVSAAVILESEGFEETSTEILENDSGVMPEEEENQEPIFIEPSVKTEEEVESSFPSAKTVNWPSPTLAPVRSPKKRKSLAAVDLPKFPRFN
jgi:hypothetical protein